MARRSTWRIPIRLKAHVNACGKVFSGMVMNISEKGMFISSEENGFGEVDNFDVDIMAGEGTMHVPAKRVRLTKINGGASGMGVEIKDPPQSYLEFVENLLFVL